MAFAGTHWVSKKVLVLLVTSRQRASTLIALETLAYKHYIGRKCKGLLCIVNTTAQQNRHNYLIGVALKELLTFTIHI